MEKINTRLLNWASVLDENTLEQAITTSTMPFIHPHVALMPDAHLGKGATVGSVIPTLGAIIPAAVGVDIGCGMIAVRTQWEFGDVEARQVRGKRLSELRVDIERAVPLSAGNYNVDLSSTAEGRVQELTLRAENFNFNPGNIAPNWPLQLGTLGSGNHFIEVSCDEEARVWVFLHSGSRGVGNKIAQAHIKVARELCKRWWIELPDPDLAYLVDGTDEFWDYIRQMMWAQAFALTNREEMMDRVIHYLEEWMADDAIEAERINCHHNFTTKERHFGQEVWVSRKGAILAEEGTPGLIPGSMGTSSYVVSGLGNRASLNSSPHGAGRSHSRTRAKKTFTHAQLRDAMEGIEWRDSDAFLDEIPQAYKDIDVVMEDAQDLVEVKHTLYQLVNVKGE